MKVAPFLLLAVALILTSCGTREPATPTPPPSPTSLPVQTPTPAHGHIRADHEASPSATGAAAFVLMRRLDGLNTHEGGAGVAGERFGIVAIAEDMDGDGVADIIVGAPRADPSGTPGSNEGSVHVYSGAALLKGAEAKEALLYRVHGEPTVNGTGEFGFRQSIATADFDGDGFPELAVGAWLADPVVKNVPRVDGGSLFVFNGAALLKGAGQEQALMFRLDGEEGSRLGRPTVTVGDINRDGIADLFVGAHRASPQGLQNAGSGYLLSGADFSPLHRFDGKAPHEFQGRSAMAIGDVNSDGYPDLAIGASQGDGGQAGGVPSGPGYVDLYSGKNYSLLHSFIPPPDEPTGSFGQTTVYGIRPGEGADLNGDGVPEIIVGSPEARAGLKGPPGKEGYPRTGSAYVYSGADFSLLYRLSGERGSGQLEVGTPSHESPPTGSLPGNVGDVFGDAVALAPDLDGDGVSEIMVGAPRGDGQAPDGSYPPDLVDSGYVKIFSGKTGALLARLGGPAKGANMGHHVLTVADVNKDGSPDLLVGADLTDFGGADAGSLYWYTISLTKTIE